MKNYIKLEIENSAIATTVASAILREFAGEIHKLTVYNHTAALVIIGKDSLAGRERLTNAVENAGAHPYYVDGSSSVIDDNPLVFAEVRFN